jgi:hypothetical protein
MALSRAVPALNSLLASGDPVLCSLFPVLRSVFAATTLISIMKFRMDKTLWFWVDVAVEHIKSDHYHMSKRQLVAQILRKYERRGDALRRLNKQGKIVWKASPRFLSMLSDAERDARDDLADFP